jgi:hypothetical protein
MVGRVRLSPRINADEPLEALLVPGAITIQARTVPKRTRSPSKLDISGLGDGTAVNWSL